MIGFALFGFMQGNAFLGVIRSLESRITRTVSLVGACANDDGSFIWRATTGVHRTKFS